MGKSVSNRHFRGPLSAVVDMGTSYLSLAAQLRQRGTQQERLLEAAASLALGRRVAAGVHLAVIVVANLLGALLARGLLLLDQSRLVAPAAGGAALGETVFHLLELSGQAGVGILGRRGPLDLLLGRLGRGGEAIMLRRLGRGGPLVVGGLGGDGRGCVARVCAGDGVEALLYQPLDCILKHAQQVSQEPGYSVCSARLSHARPDRVQIPHVCLLACLPFAH